MTLIKQWAIKGARVLGLLPWFVVSIVLGFALKENFPFSNWPMYSVVSPVSVHSYVVDGRQQPIASVTFRETSARINKQFVRERRDQSAKFKRSGKPNDQSEIERLAGEHLLGRLAGKLTPAQRKEFGALGLIHVEITLGPDRSLDRAAREVARIPLDTVATVAPAETDFSE